MKYFLDANIFLRFLVKENNKLFKECRALLEKVKEGEVKAITSNIVFSEVIWVLRSHYNKQRKKVAKAVFPFFEMRNLKILDQFNSRNAIKIYSENSVKFIDALIASNSKIQEEGLTIVSYDKDFDKLGVKRKEPSQVL